MRQGNIAGSDATAIIGQALDPTPSTQASPGVSTTQQPKPAIAVSSQPDSALTDTSTELTSPESQSPVSAQQLRDKYNRLFEMAESAPEGPLSDSPHEHGIIDSFLSAHGHNPSPQLGPTDPQTGAADGAASSSHAASGAGVTGPRSDAHLSLTEMLLLEEDSLAESKATPLLQHRVSMASNIADVFPLSPSSSASPLHSERSMLASPDYARGADSASSQQQPESSGHGGWPGSAPEWISVVMRGKHGGSREAFIQYHVPEGLVYVNSTNLTLKVSSGGLASCASQTLATLPCRYIQYVYVSARD